MSLEVTVIIVNYNTGDLISRCIDSVLNQQNIQFEIIVVDNVSMDNSIEVLKKYEQKKHIILVENQKNVGFGCANNQIEKIAQAKYLFLLNPDCIMNDNLSLRHCVDYMDKHSEVGMAGTRIFEPRKNRMVKAQVTYPCEKNLKHTATFAHLPGNIAWILGASMIISKNIYQQADGFDPDFFLYGEETDLCLRIRKNGYEIAIIDNVCVEHYSGASERQSSPKEIYLRKQQGFYQFCRKHYNIKDVVGLAKKNLWRSRIKLIFLNFLALYNTKKFSPKVQRLYANIQAAKECIESLSLVKDDNK